MSCVEIWDSTHQRINQTHIQSCQAQHGLRDVHVSYHHLIVHVSGQIWGRIIEEVQVVVNVVETRPHRTHKDTQSGVALPYHSIVEMTILIVVHDPQNGLRNHMVQTDFLEGNSHRILVSLGVRQRYQAPEVLIRTILVVRYVELGLPHLVFSGSDTCILSNEIGQIR